MGQSRVADVLDVAMGIQAAALSVAAALLYQRRYWELPRADEAKPLVKLQQAEMAQEEDEEGFVDVPNACAVGRPTAANPPATRSSARFVYPRLFSPSARRGIPALVGRSSSRPLPAHPARLACSPAAASGAGCAHCVGKASLCCWWRFGSWCSSPA